jgi:uncharacterized repeat protein (TIGR01451 family)
MKVRGVFFGLAAALVCLLLLGTTAFGQSDPPAPGSSQPVLPPLPPLPKTTTPRPPESKSEPKGLPDADPLLPAAPLVPSAAKDVLPGRNPDAGNDLAVDAGPGQTNENPTGRQEPGVSLEWIGPPTTKIGQPATYQIIVKNISSCPVQHVVIRNRVPNGITVQNTEPKGFNEGNLWLWDLGTLAATARETARSRASGRGQGRSVLPGFSHFHRRHNRAHPCPRAEAGLEGFSA